MRQQFGALPHQLHPPSQQISSRAHTFGIHVGFRDHAAAQEHRDFVGVDLVVLRLTAVDGFHVQCVAENESNLFSSAQIGQPVPREDAFDGNHDILAERCDRFQKRIRIRLHIAVQNDRTGLVQDEQVHGSRVQINSAVMHCCCV